MFACACVPVCVWGGGGGRTVNIIHFPISSLGGRTLGLVVEGRGGGGGQGGREGGGGAGGGLFISIWKALYKQNKSLQARLVLSPYLISLFSFGAIGELSPLQTHSSPSMDC